MCRTEYFCNYKPTKVFAETIRSPQRLVYHIFYPVHEDSVTLLMELGEQLHTARILPVLQCQNLSVANEIMWSICM